MILSSQKKNQDNLSNIRYIPLILPYHVKRCTWAGLVCRHDTSSGCGWAGMGRLGGLWGVHVASGRAGKRGVGDGGCTWARGGGRWGARVGEGGGPWGAGAGEAAR